ncbi:MAG: hypothetical protein ACOX05_02880 [Bacillota bacterium]|jgi:DNA-binding transcriptional regulator YhcF (GntR family)
MTTTVETKLHELFETMQEYTKMTDELSFKEFSSYYQQVMEFLQKDYQELDEEGLLKIKGICSIMFANAQARSMNKDINRKKFIKMAEKANFWQNAIQMKLKKDGLSESEISAREEAFFAEDEEAADKK